MRSRLRTTLTLTLCWLLTCPSAYTRPPSDTDSPISLSEQDARDLLKAAEAYFLLQAELNIAQTGLFQVQGQLLAVQAALEAAQKEAETSRGQNERLRADLDALRDLELQRAENYQAQVKKAEKKKWRWMLYGALGGLVVGAAVMAAH